MPLPRPLSFALGRVLRVYSEAFRQEFGDDMARLFASQYLARATQGGRLGLWWFAGTTLLSMFCHALADRADGWLSPAVTPPRRNGPVSQTSRSKSSRGARMSSLLHDLREDLRQGIRNNVTSPAFAVVAVSTLALGISVNATIFSLVNALLLSDLPIVEPERFAFIWATNESAGRDRSTLALADAYALRTEAESFEGVAVTLEASYVLTGESEAPSRVFAMQVTTNMFALWGIDTVIGRDFLPGEDRRGSAPVAVLSHGFWDRRYGRNPEVLGRVVELDGEAHTIVGVLSPRIEFGDISTVDLWVPLRLELETALPGIRGAFVTARLSDGASFESAQQEVSLLASRLEERDPAHNRGWGLRVSPVTEELVDDEDSAIVLLAVLCGGFVLLIACSNVANMFLARATRRSREIAVRLALGAGRVRLHRQLLAEGLLLAIPAGALGLLLTQALTRILVYASAERQWIYRAMTIDRNVLLFALAVTVATPLVFALVPSLRASRLDVSSALREGGRSGAGRSALRARGYLVAAQVAMAISLMVVTGLLVRAAIVIRTFDLGFQPRGILTAELRLSERDYATAASQSRLFLELGERVSASPGVSRAAFAFPMPLALAPPARPFVMEGATYEDRELPTAQFSVISPGYLELMRVPLLRGRDLDARDHLDAARVALVNARLEQMYFAGSEALGRRIRLPSDVEGGGEGDWLEIVGVVGDTFDVEVATVTGAREWTTPIVYLPMAQNASPRMSLLVRGGADAPPESLVGEVRQAVDSFGEGVVLVGAGTMDDALELLYASSNALISLFLIFAVFALSMAAMGIYGVMSYAVTQREHEIGVRMALGASRRAISRMILEQSGRFVLLGGVVGLGVAFVFGRLIATTLVGVSPHDPVTFASVFAVLVAVALLANYVPSRRATRVDPLSALRAD